MIKRGLLRLEGWGYLIAIALLAAIVIWPLVQSLLDNQQRERTAQSLIVSHIADLSAEPPANEYLKYQSFIFTRASEDAATAMTSSEIQTALIDLIKLHKARLVDLRVRGTDTSIETLEAQGFNLEFEGDLQAVLDTVQALGTLSQPVLIDTITIKPVGRFDRPDRRMRVSLELSFWTESPQS